MEKLIELLQIYDNRSDFIGYTIQYRIENGNVQRSIKGTDRRASVWWYSKSFGFIKWLLENDKIDIKALVVKGEMRSGWDFDNKKWNEEAGEEIWNKYYSELCLMLLSIQDNPIDFLLSILK